MTTLTEDAIIANLLPWLGIIIHDKSVKLEIHTPLITQNLIDSMDLLQMVTWAETTYGISIDPDAMTPENFETPQKFAALLLSTQAG